MIFTSYFAKYRGEGGISIARKQPKSDHPYPECVELMPSSSMLWKFKKGQITEEEFTTLYKARILARLDPKAVGDKLQGKVLLCWEKPENFCHRHIVADWLKDNGYDVMEVGQRLYVLDMPEVPETGSCLYCKYGKLDCEHTPIRLTCRNKLSRYYKKKTKCPTRKSCNKWRYKF